MSRLCGVAKAVAMDHELAVCVLDSAQNFLIHVGGR